MAMLPLRAVCCTKKCCECLFYVKLGTMICWYLLHEQKSAVDCAGYFTASCFIYPCNATSMVNMAYAGAYFLYYPGL